MRSPLFAVCLSLVACDGSPTPFNGADAAPRDTPAPPDAPRADRPPAIDTPALPDVAMIDAPALPDVAMIDTPAPPDVAAMIDAPAPPADAGAARFTAVPIGASAPDWRVERVWTVSSEFGYRRDDTPSWGDFHDLFAAPNHAYSARLDQTAHLVAHDGPYDREVDLALLRAGRTPRERFSAREFFAPKAVYIVLLLVPTEAAPRGRTPDGPMRPMIANETFPIMVDGRIYRDSSVYDENPGSTLPQPPVAFEGAWEGHTHAFYTLAEDSEYAPPTAPIEGRFEWRPTVIDARSRGYRLTIPFEVRCTDTDRDIPNCGGPFDAGVPDVSTEPDVSAPPDLPATTDAPSGPTLIGEPCATDADCGPGGVCLTSPGVVTFPGGYCTRDCSGHAMPCGDDPSAECVSILIGRSTPFTCFRHCGDGCRAGYRCASFLTTAPICFPM